MIQKHKQLDKMWLGGQDDEGGARALSGERSASAGGTVRIPYHFYYSVSSPAQSQALSSSLYIVL